MDFTTMVRSSVTRKSGNSQTPLADELARISREEFDRYLREFRSTEQKVIGSLGESTVGAATDAAQKDAIRSRETLNRMRERFGVSVDPTIAAGEARQARLSDPLNALTAGNNAADFDRDNKRQTLAGLLNIGQGIRQQALGGFGSAAGMEGARVANDSANRNAYTQQKAANKAQMISSVASLGAMALFM